jgi:hypothetical protein
VQCSIRCGRNIGQRFRIFARPFTISSYWLTPQPQTQTSIWLIGESKMLAGTARRQEMPWSITKKNMGAETRNSGAIQAADHGGHRA